MVAPGTRRSMLSNRGKDTIPEVRIRSALHRRGFRFSKHVRPLPDLRCTADIVFPRLRIAVFVDGCFWHGCPMHATRPATNAEWWAAKLDRTVQRDQHNVEVLEAAGWVCVRVWEHQSVDEVCQLVGNAVTRRRT